MANWKTKDSAYEGATNVPKLFILLKLQVFWVSCTVFTVKGYKHFRGL
jgi:hypothetical protein